MKLKLKYTKLDKVILILLAMTILQFLFIDRFMHGPFIVGVLFSHHVPELLAIFLTAFQLIRIKKRKFVIGITGGFVFVVPTIILYGPLFIGGIVSKKLIGVIHIDPLQLFLLSCIVGYIPYFAGMWFGKVINSKAYPSLRQAVAYE